MTVRRDLWVALLLAAAFLLAGATWALSSPPGSSPDDDFHLSSIWCADGLRGDSCTRPDGSGFIVPADVAQAACFARDATMSGSCIAKVGHGPAVARVNSGTYPPVFYLTMRQFVVGSVSESVVLMRLVNVCIAAALLAAAVVLCPPRVRRALSLGWLGTLVPLTLFVIPSTNPSSWTVTGVGTYWAFLFAYLEAPGRRRIVVSGAFMSVAALLAIGSRADGAAYIGLSTVAVLVMLEPFRRMLTLRVALPAAIVAIGAVVYLTTGQSSFVGGFTPLDGAPLRDGTMLLLGNIYQYPTLLLGAFGLAWGLGWLDTVLPTIVGFVSAATAFTLVATSLSSFWLRKTFAVLLMVVAVVALPLYVLQGGNNVVGENVQPRYFLPLVIVAVALIVIKREDGPADTPGRAGMVFLVLALALANLVALHEQMRRYITGTDGPPYNLNALREWWWSLPFEPMTLFVVGSVAGVALFGMLALVACLDDRRPTSGRHKSAGRAAEPAKVSETSAA